MRTSFDQLEKQAGAISFKFDADPEQLWIDELKRRYDALLNGALEAVPGDEVMDRSQKRLRNFPEEVDTPQNSYDQRRG